ncbi:DNA gyrase inhibitor YacG [Breoghania sp.]|uniref:DNA gyrase inhibitor YacG n=1 Tax=Breoghania sp. TaxID=2065378 RepID=UPI003749ABB7
MSTDKTPGKTLGKTPGTAQDVDGTKRPVRPCPHCSKLSVEKYYPFCSARCADVDLHSWLSGNYAIPAVELDDVDPEELGALASMHAPDRQNDR